MAESSHEPGDEAAVARPIELPEDSSKGEQEAAADAVAGADVAEAVTPPRRFYANLADL